MKNKTLSITLSTSLLIFATAFASNVSAVTITPMQGQTPEQIQKDQADCNAMAQQSASSQTAAPAPKGGAMRGAAKGAMAGAAKAEVQGQQHGAYDRVNEDVKQQYRQNEAKSAAAAGAVVGAAKQRQQRNQASQQSATSSQAVDQAFGSCMMGRGYNVQ